MKCLFLRMALLSVYAIIFQTTIIAQPARVSGLPNRTTLSFSGAKKQNGVELKGILSSSHSYNKMIIERTSSAEAFSYIGEMDISGTASSTFPFTFLDNQPENGVNYYRIRLVNSITNIQEISNTLMVKKDNDRNDLEVINTFLSGGNAMLSIRSLENKDADLQLADLSGRIFTSTRTKLNSGFNNINLPGFNNAKGYFVLVVRTSNNSISQKILIQ